MKYVVVIIQIPESIDFDTKVAVDIFSLTKLNI